MGESRVHNIIRKCRSVFVREIQVGLLDKNKCSNKFLRYCFDDDKIVYVKCLENGDLDLRGKKEEYRILVPDSQQSTTN